MKKPLIHRCATRRLSPQLVVTLWGALLAAGCGDNHGNPGPDGSTNDASIIPDASNETDEDGDGYPASQDCDDHDPNMYPGVLEACFSECNEGVHGCRSDGTFSPCTADTSCACDTPGLTRIVPCGRCGQGSQRCEASGTWSLPTDCQGEGDCLPGALEDVTCEFCGGTGSRLCGDQCQWLPVEGCNGECLPGDIRRGATECSQVYEAQEETCSEQCEWEVTQPCTTGCLLAPRVGNGDYKDEVCVDGGDFTMGSDPGATYPDETPKHTVSLTPYFIDVYEVTCDRYLECVNDGVCTQQESWSLCFEPGHGSFAVNYVTHDQASTFCQWDGGRVLPTEAQFEKAARGPYPRQVRSPWGDAAPTCDLVAITDCQGDVWGPFAVDLCPAGNSYYGLYNMAANVREWVADWFDANYYAVSPILDPTGPVSGTERSIRGMGYRSVLSSYDDTVTIRYSLDPTQDDADLGFRCARPGY